LPAAAEDVSTSTSFVDLVAPIGVSLVKALRCAVATAPLIAFRF